MDKFIAIFKKIEARIDFFYGALFGAVGLFFGLGWFSLAAIPACGRGRRLRLRLEGSRLLGCDVSVSDPCHR